MFNIAQYLEKFKQLSVSRNFLRDSVVEAIKEVCKIEINSKNIDFKDGILRIKEKPIIKNEIFLKKNKILDFLNTKIQGKVKDIL